MEKAMSPVDRKTLVANYKEQPTIAGVFAVICSATASPAPATAIAAHMKA